MTDNTDPKKATEFMTELWERAAARDAALEARLAAIMTRKPARVRKVEPEQTWIDKRAPSGKKDNVMPPDNAGKANRNKKGKPKW